MLSRRLQRSIDARLVTSVQNVERSLEDEGISLTDSLPVVASGAAAIGALGLAAAATSVATSTATIMVFIPVSTVSWPLFAAFGAGALTLGFFPHGFWNGRRIGFGPNTSGHCMRRLMLRCLVARRMRLGCARNISRNSMTCVINDWRAFHEP